MSKVTWYSEIYIESTFPFPFVLMGVALYFRKLNERIDIMGNLFFLIDQKF